MRDPAKGHAALRKGRWSALNSTYFLTICLRKGQSGLDSKELFEASLTILKSLENGICKVIHGIVHMPDHIHLLIQLSAENELSHVVRLHKGRMTPNLRIRGLNWQGGYYDRRIRPQDSIGRVLRYMLLNPYRKNLITALEEWPFCYSTELAKSWISLAMHENIPEPEWLGK
jgi:putative transposase